MSGYGEWVLLALAAAVGYIVTCVVWPFAACRKCRGEGKFRSWFGGESWRRCGRCKGSGERVRVGRRAWTWWSETWSKGAR